MEFYIKDYLDLLLPLPMGIIMLSVVWYSFQKKKRLQKTGIRTDGIVFKVDNSYTTIQKDVTVRFVTEKQEWVTGIALESTSLLKEGDQVHVIYNPLNPDDFTIEIPFFSMLYILLLACGCMITIWGIYRLIVHFLH